MRTIAATVTIAAALAAAPSAAQASSVQTTMAVTANTVNSCAVAAQPLAFGTVNQIGGAATDSQTTVVVTCTPGVAYNVGLDQGAHAMSGVRQMQSAAGSTLIPYLVYQDAARTTTWGNTVGTDTVARTATLTPTTLAVYGRVPANAPLAPAGLYADLVTVTVTF